MVDMLWLEDGVAIVVVVDDVWKLAEDMKGKGENGLVEFLLLRSQLTTVLNLNFVNLAPCPVISSSKENNAGMISDRSPFFGVSNQTDHRRDESCISFTSVNGHWRLKRPLATRFPNLSDQAPPRYNRTRPSKAAISGFPWI